MWQEEGRIEVANPNSSGTVEEALGRHGLTALALSIWGWIWGVLDHPVIICPPLSLWTIGQMRRQISHPWGYDNYWDFTFERNINRALILPRCNVTALILALSWMNIFFLVHDKETNGLTTGQYTLEN